MAQANDKTNTTDQKAHSFHRLTVILWVVMLVAITAATTLSLVFVLKPRFLSGETVAAVGDEATSMPSSDSEAIYVSLDSPLLLTYLNGGRTHYVKLKFSLMSRHPDIRTFATSHKDRLIHEWLMALQPIPFKGLLTSEGKTALQSQALAVAQTVAQQESPSVVIEQVLFTQFVIQ